LFDFGEVVEFPDDEGDFFDEDSLGGGGRVVFFGEFAFEGVEVGVFEGAGDSGGG
jgi:hypothetical protein